MDWHPILLLTQCSWGGLWIHSYPDQEKAATDDDYDNDDDNYDDYGDINVDDDYDDDE